MFLDPLKPLFSALNRNKQVATPYYIQKEINEIGQIQVLSTRSKPDKLIKIKGEKMNVELKRTTSAEYELFKRLIGNESRAILEQISKEKIGLTGKSTKTVELLSFIVGRYRNKIESELNSQKVFIDIYDRTDPVELAKVITIDKGNSKVIEIRWITDPTIITDEWDRAFDLASAPKTQEKPRELTPWERRGLSEEEFNIKKSMSRLEDIQEQNPTQFQALLDLVESGNLDKLVKLADSL
jgi:hypothetical protein